MFYFWIPICTTFTSLASQMGYDRSYAGLQQSPFQVETLQHWGTDRATPRKHRCNDRPFVELRFVVFDGVEWGRTIVSTQGIHPLASTTSWVDLLKLVCNGQFSCVKIQIINTETHLLECIALIGSQLLALRLNLSLVCIHMVPSFPPIQYRYPSSADTPQLLRLEVILGTADQLPTRGSNRFTDDW